MSQPTELEQQEEQDADRQAVDEQAIQDKGQVVRWHGQAGVDYREISVEDWNRAGVDLDKDGDGNDRTTPVRTIRWHAGNDYAVPLSVLEEFLTDEQIRQYIGSDNRFKIEEG